MAKLQQWLWHKLSASNSVITIYNPCVNVTWHSPQNIFSGFYDRMTVHRNRFLVNKTNRCIEFQFYWYYYSTCFGQPFCPSSGVLSCTSASVHFMQFWPFATRSRMSITPGSKRSQLYKVHRSRSTAKNSWWWAERLPETCRVVIPIKFQFSASVGFIHKEYIWWGSYIAQHKEYLVLLTKNRRLAFVIVLRCFVVANHFWNII